MNLSELIQRNTPVKIVIDAAQYDIVNDNRFLVPFMRYDWNAIHFGFADKTGNIVIPAIYDKVFDDFRSSDDLVRVGKRFFINYGTDEKPRQYEYFHCGLINAIGEELIPCNKYRELYYADDERTLLLAHGSRQKSECALVDLQGHEIIPYGTYSQIELFHKGLARVTVYTSDEKGRRVENHGLIDLKGQEVVPVGKGPAHYRWYEHYSINH